MITPLFQGSFRCKGSFFMELCKILGDFFVKNFAVIKQISIFGKQKTIII